MRLSAWIAMTVLVSCFIPALAHADTCKSEIRDKNIIGNALLTLAFRAVNGEVNRWQDVGEGLFWGAVGGNLFHQSRRVIGNGDEDRGIAMSFLAASITENTALGMHPLGYLRYGIGPVDFRIRTPLAGEEGDTVSVGLNVLDTLGALEWLINDQATDFRLRNGVLYGLDKGAVEDDFVGITRGRSVAIEAAFDDDVRVWKHELIHTSQYLQHSAFGSVGVGKWKLYGNDSLVKPYVPKGMHVRLEWFNVVAGAIDDVNDYEHRWFEMEAARMANDQTPANDPNDSCVAQVGFGVSF